MIIFKQASQACLHDNMQYALTYLEHLFEEYGETLIVNSGRRSHQQNKIAGGKSNSKHLEGKAIDISTSILNNIDRERIYIQIKSNLDIQGYDIVQYLNHIHIEYDPKKGDFLNEMPNTK